MAVGDSGVSLRARLTIAAVSIGAVAIAALVVMASGSRIGRAITAKADSPVASRAEAVRKAKGEIASMPAYFEVNQGQTDPSVKYLSRSGRYSTYLTDDATIISMIGGQIHKGPQLYTVAGGKPSEDKLVESDLRVKFLGANSHPKFVALNPLAGRVNYLIGDPSKWHRSIPTFGRVEMAGVYPGIDVIYYGNPGTMECDIVAAPGADLSKVRLALEGPAKTTLDSWGNVRLQTAAAWSRYASRTSIRRAPTAAANRSRAPSRLTDAK